MIFIPRLPREPRSATYRTSTNGSGPDPASDDRGDLLL